jgi:2-polyprenyl-3-methyl-5-hydroxy-6-metoxy-1,4-benzoquinol methylase
LNKKNDTTAETSTEINWFSIWFNTPFYHLLYNKRDEKEADAFITRLIKHLGPPKYARVLDLACGAGRHSKTLNKCGLDVTGVDIATNSIEKAKHFENKHLHFKVHDMREVFEVSYFDYIFNLFTSFGYFATVSDDQKVIKASWKQLKPGGLLIIDFLNINAIRPTLPYEGIEKRNEIDFQISKCIKGKRIVKKISFECQGHHYNFEERVAAYSVEDFKKMLSSSGFEITDLFGDYELGEYHESSDRLIIIARKIAS